jgi:CheY-like chemotaxis protein
MSTSPTEQPVSHRVLLEDDDDAVRDMMNATLEHKGFEVVAAASEAPWPPFFWKRTKS